MHERHNSSPINNPVVLCTSASNHEAHLIAAQLNENGIPAAVVEDQSPVGMTAIGLLPGIHRPQVFIDRSQLDVARDLMASIETLEPQAAGSFCYHCGGAINYSGKICSECGAQVEQDAESDADENPCRVSDRLRTQQRRLGLLLLAPALAIPAAILVIVWYSLF